MRKFRAILTAAYGFNAVILDMDDKRFTVNCNPGHVDFGKVKELVFVDNHYMEVELSELPTKRKVFLLLSRTLDATVAARILPKLRV